jgi:hypothetical protein
VRFRNARTVFVTSRGTSRRESADGSDAETRHGGVTTITKDLVVFFVIFVAAAVGAPQASLVRSGQFHF